jgi:hypothetical protein
MMSLIDADIIIMGLAILYPNVIVSKARPDFQVKLRSFERRK